MDFDRIISREPEIKELSSNLGDEKPCADSSVGWRL